MCSLFLQVIYCIGIFALMLSSLIETIFVNYLMEKDSSSLEDKKESDKLRKIQDVYKDANNFHCYLRD